MPYVRNKRTGEMVFVPDQQMPADPAFQYQGPKAALEVEGKRADITNDAARVALERERVELARQAQRTAQGAQQRAAEVSQRERDAKLGQLRALEGQLRRTWDLYSRGPGSTKGLGAIADYLPSQTNSRFNTAGAGLGETGFAAFRVPGSGPQSDNELRQFIEANRPSADDFDGKIEEKLGNIERRLAETYKPYGVKYKPYRPGRTPPPRKKPSVIDFNDLP